jgi:hypothetical protein
VDPEWVRSAFMAQGREIGIFFDLRPLKKGALYPPPLDVRLPKSKGFEINSPYEDGYAWLGQIRESEAIAEFNREYRNRNDQLHHYDGFGNINVVCRVV